MQEKRQAVGWRRTAVKIITVILAIALSGGVVYAQPQMFRVTSMGIPWQDNADILLFPGPAQLIRPGYERSGAEAYRFIIENQMHEALRYLLSMDYYFTKGESQPFAGEADRHLRDLLGGILEFRIYANGTPENERGAWIMLDSLVTIQGDLARDASETYCLEWRWPLSVSESRDARDSLAGAISADETIRFYLRVTIVAEGATDSGNPDTGDHSLWIWPAVAVLSSALLGLAAAFAPGKKRNQSGF